MRHLLAIVGLIVSVGAAAAGSERQGLTVSPVQVSLDAAQRAAAVTLSNGTGEDKVIQVELLRWQRMNGEDQYAPTKELLVNPPLFRLAPGASQIVRVGLAAPAAATSDREQAYRLYLEEVPQGQTQAEESVSRLRLLLRFGVPVFVRPAKPAPEALRWHAVRLSGGDIRLELSNAGNTHVRASEVALGPSGVGPEQFVRAGSFAYVFPGETYAWILRPALAPRQRSLTVTARTDRGEIRAELPLAGQ